MKKNNRILALAFAGFFALTAYAVDPVPVMRTNITDATEANVAEVFLSSGRYRLGVDIGSGPFAVTQSGTWTTGRTWTLSNSTDSIASVQSGTWTVQQGSTPTSVANAWPFKLTDGTNTTAVKAASTAPVATDQAAVVVLSPNGNHATAANQSTEITALQLIDNPVGSASGGTAGTSSFLAGGVYNSSLPTLTNGQQSGLQLTTKGSLHNNLRDSTGTETGTHSNRLKTEDNFNSKVRSDASFTSVSLTTGVCTTYYSYSGSGVLIGFSSEFSNNNVIVQALVDGENILPSGFSISQLNSLNALANSTDRRQSGSGIVTSGAKIDWSLKKPIRFNTSVLLCADANGGGISSRSFQQGIVYLTKE